MRVRDKSFSTPAGVGLHITIIIVLQTANYSDIGSMKDAFGSMHTDETDERLTMSTRKLSAMGKADFVKKNACDLKFRLKIRSTLMLKSTSFKYS